MFYRGHSQFVQLMKEFAYSLVARAPCPLTGGEQPLSYTRTSFYLEAVKLSPALLSGRRFSSSPGDDRADYVQFPSQVISVPTAVSDLSFCIFRDFGYTLLECGYTVKIVFYLPHSLTHYLFLAVCQCTLH